MPNDDSFHEILDLDQARVRLGGNEAMLRDLAALFLEHSPEWMNRLEHALQEEDCDEVYRVAHDLKGSTQIFGAASASKAAQRIEKMGRFGDLHHLSEAFSALKTELVSVKNALQTYLHQDD